MILCTVLFWWRGWYGSLHLVILFGPWTYHIKHIMKQQLKMRPLLKWLLHRTTCTSVVDPTRQVSSSSSSRSHLVVGSLRQTQFSSSQFCHGLHLSSFRWLSCLGWHSPSISASVFLFFFSQVVPSPKSFFRCILGLVSLRGQTTSVLLSCTSLLCSLPSVSPWCHHTRQLCLKIFETLTKAVSTRHFSEPGAIDRDQFAPSCPCPHGSNRNARSSF